MSCEAAEAVQPKQPTTPICGFPSSQLLAYRRRLAEESSHTADPGRTRLIMQTIMAIDTLRHFHDDVDNCCCWYVEAGSAYRAEKSEPVHG